MKTSAVILLCVALLSAGCRRQNDATAGAASDAASAVPETEGAAKVLKGRVICPLEIVNGKSIRQSRSFRIGSKATLVGWSRVADAERPVPPLVYVVFRSNVPDGSVDLFWPGIRVARPDVANGNPRMVKAGYSASGSFPTHPGQYKVLVRVGDQNLQRECDTGETLWLQD